MPFDTRHHFELFDQLERALVDSFLKLDLYKFTRNSAVMSYVSNGKVPEFIVSVNYEGLALCVIDRKIREQILSKYQPQF